MLCVFSRSTMSESHLMGFLVLLSILPTASTIGILNSINDLKKIPFGQSVPKHSLVLLHWFANTIEIDNNDAIELTFEPNHGDYGTHHYGNYEGVLDRLPFGQQYYTLGNSMINNHRISLPSYVTGDLNHLLGGEVMNRARIVFSLLGQDIIDQVFITQHYHASQGQGTVYDPVHTYQITINLLRELREFSLDQNQQSELSDIGTNFGSGIDYDELCLIRNTWGQLACVGLLLFIVINERNTSTPQSMMYYPPYHPIYGQAARQNRANKLCITIASLTLAFIGAMIIIGEMVSTGPHWGTLETTVPLNKRHQVRLRKDTRFCLYFTRQAENMLTISKQCKRGETKNFKGNCMEAKKTTHCYIW
uniref:Uncharacterized protein n=1 Tax=Gadus morhua TaxID=8049 RepID=A0A8C5BSM8_GADMO